jgi:hypothetical protein
MIPYSTEEIVRFVGTAAILLGGVILASGASSGKSVVVAGLLVVGGLLLRIEAAILRAGRTSRPHQATDSSRPGSLDPEGFEP